MAKRASDDSVESWTALVVDKDDKHWRGSGVVVGPRHVLTALHVLKGEARCRVRLQTDGEGYPACVAWRSADLDVALLVTDDVVDAAAQITSRCRPGYISGDVQWHAYGYPGLYAEKPTRQRQQEGGRTLFWAPGSDLPLALTIPGGPKGERALNGLSGAGVLIDHRVAAIVLEFENARKQERIDAVPLSRFFGDPGFRAAAGLPTTANTDARWQRMRMSMLLVLANDSVHRAFATRLDPPPTNAVALLNTLLQRPALEVAQMLNHVVAELIGTARDHALRLRVLLLALVPCLLDQQELRDAQREALQSGECCFELPCRNVVMIEALMASLSPRAMCSPDAVLAGDGGPLLKLASVAYAPVADVDGSAVVDGVARQIAWLEGIDEHGKSQPELLDAVTRHLQALLEKTHGPLDTAYLVEEVEDLLQFTAERPDDGFHYYLHFDALDAAHAALWADKRQALRTALPGLWLVRSTDRHKSERRLVAHLKDAAFTLQKAMPSDD